MYFSLVLYLLYVIAAVKRILTEAKELREPTDLFHAQPLEVNAKDVSVVLLFL
jgi:hypothetical protein